MLLYHIHHIIEKEYKLLHSLHFKSGSASQSGVIIHQDTVDTLIGNIAPNQRNNIKRIMKSHLRKIRKLNESPFDVRRETMKKYFEALKELREDPVSKTMSDKKTIAVANQIQQGLQNMSLDEKKKILKKEEKTQMGLVSGLLKILAKVMKGIEITSVTVVQLATIIMLVACLVQMFSVPPIKAFRQRMTSMVTTGDFITNLNDNSNTNIIQRFAKSAMFQDNQLLWTTGVRPVKIFSSPGNATMSKINKFVPVETLVTRNDIDVLISLPLDSRDILDKLNRLTKIQLNYYSEVEKAKIRAEAVSEMTNEILSTTLEVVTSNPLGIIYGIIKTIGSKLYKNLLEKKLKVAINIAMKTFRYASAEFSKESLYQKRMNEGLTLLFDSILSSFILSAMLKASAWLAERNANKKLMIGLKSADFINFWWRLTNIFCYSFAYSLTDVALNDGIAMIGDITGVPLLKSVTLGQSVGLIVITSVSSVFAIRGFVNISTDGIQLLNDIFKDILNKKDAPKYDRNVPIYDRMKNMAEQEMKAEIEKIEAELSSAKEIYSSKVSRVAFMKF